ncbi:N-acetyl-gamma-glutamyl-phosphate reductase [Kocuria palustris]|uniref:N-acetyl-gamma-glutamyl-phosphate reductase n=1 Tax=Kocuria palustris TaxID=71999 RepID=UPI0024697E90|nr:N-acetyl-gamma-glutamyl-phosphate reductase [Kocuria palustris]MDH5152546.1 N-acetyl-gamma-glutamyl-phosphate reductase [Kocuria palustris]
MTFTAAVSGASGYAGGEVLRLLMQHPQVEIGAVAAHSSAGQRLGSLQPHLHGLADRIITDSSLEQLAGHDIVVLALPHGASAEIAAQLPESSIVIDAAADHRLESAEAWEQFYGSAHAGTWPYGLPEMIVAPDGTRQRTRLAKASRIAIPGCYPTGSQLALAPLAAAGQIELQDIVIVAASGTSGAGRSLKPHLLAAEVMGGMSPYGVGGVHRHTPEIEQGLGWASGRSDVAVSFTPTLAPMPRGILTTATARIAEGAGAQFVREALEEAYRDEPFIHLLPEGQWPTTQAVLGSNHVQIQAAVDARVGRVIVSCALDNLVKGTAGGAVQSMNIALGLPEQTGLTQQGVAP